MNRCGDLFVVMEDSSVWMFDVDRGTFERLAISRDDFCNQLEIDENRHSRLKDIVGDMTEVTKMLSEVAQQQTNSKDQKESKNEVKQIKLHNVDSVHMDKLNETI